MADIASPIKTLGAFPAIDPTVAAIGTADQIADGAKKAIPTTAEILQIAAANAAVSDWTVPAQAPVAGHYINKANGQPVAQVNYQYVDYDRVGDEAALRITVSVLGIATAGAVYLDADGALIAAATELVGTTSLVVYTDQLLSPPSNWAKLRVTGRSDGGGIVRIDASRPVSGLAARLSSAEGDVSTLQSNVSSLGDDVADTRASLSAPGAWVTPTQAPVAGHYINKANGNPTALANYQYVKIALTGEETGVRATAFMLGIATALATYYDEAGAFIGTEVAGTDVGTLYTDYVLTPPVNARWVAVTGRSADGGIVRIDTQNMAVSPSVAQDLAALTAKIAERGGGIGSTALCMWGDSMTEAGSGYGNELAALYPSRAAYNQGIGGQKVDQIAARMGATPVTLTVGITIPTSGAVNLAHTGLSIDLLRRGSGTAVIKVIIAGVLCKLHFDATGFSGAGGYVVTPIDYPPAAVVVASGTRVEVLTGFVTGTDPTNCISLATLLSGVVCLRAGRNNINGVVDLAPIYRMIDAMVTQARRYTDKIIIIGQLFGWVDLPVAQGGNRATDELSYAIFNNAAQLNEYQRRAYAGWFFDPMARHVAAGGGETKTVAPNGVSKDFVVLTTTAASPTLGDGLHENATGQSRTAEGVKATIDAREL